MRKLILLAFCVAACIDPYQPPEVAETGELIAIEGIVNTTDHVATVRLTHPIVLNKEGALEPERGASVSIKTENGQTYTLPESEPGLYKLSGIGIKPGTSCYLSLHTRGGSEFESNIVEMRESPPIDSVYFNYLKDGLEVLVDTHDPGGKTKYYQWYFEETWEYGAAHESQFIMENGLPRYRNIAERIYRCWKTAPSTKITIASTKHLAQDIVSKKQLVFIPVGSQKISIKYSILVKQRAITEDEFIYQSQLQKTTESVGGLFDPQPSQVYGNVRRVSEKGGTAIGYFSGGSYDQKRIFQGFYELPPSLLVPPSRIGCSLDTVCLYPPNSSPIKCSIDLANMSPSEYLIGDITRGISTVGFTKATSDCADCRTQGGVLKRPDFW